MIKLLATRMALYCLVKSVPSTCKIAYVLFKNNKIK